MWARLGRLGKQLAAEPISPGSGSPCTAHAFSPSPSPQHVCSRPAEGLWHPRPPHTLPRPAPPRLAAYLCRWMMALKRRPSRQLEVKLSQRRPW